VRITNYRASCDYIVVGAEGPAAMAIQEAWPILLGSEADWAGMTVPCRA
jgi:hypothetical protein